jgi:probable selenium-dependent hydroxylase accessory protein YqeC
MSADLLELLGARRGIVCATGAGGKKSVLFAIAARHPGHVAFTTTVRTLPPPESLGGQVVLAGEDQLEAQLRALGPQPFVAYACPGDKPGRLAAVPGARITALHQALGLDVTLVKADGARMRWVKAPAPDEPVLPPGMTTLLPVMSARALGEPLGDRIAHRVERLAELVGAAPGEPFTPACAARLLASEEGLLKGAADARVVPVINMVDDAEKLALATAAAEAALELTDRFDRVVLLRLNRPEPVVAVIGAAA